MPRLHGEFHRIHRVGWLRAGVLGANDGIISTASLILGVAASGSSHEAVLIAGVASLVAGAMSMAAGEYVSVHSQADAEQADLTREQGELDEDRHAEHRELTNIYMERGLKPDLAREVATQMMSHDALGAHARDELGITQHTTARPLQAAWTSAASFAAGAALPLLIASLVPVTAMPLSVGASALAALALLGALGSRAGGAPLLRGAMRVGFWGAVAMGITSLIGTLLGTAI